MSKNYSTIQPGENGKIIRNIQTIKIELRRNRKSEFFNYHMETESITEDLPMPRTRWFHW